MNAQIQSDKTARARQVTRITKELLNFYKGRELRLFKLLKAYNVPNSIIAQHLEVTPGAVSLYYGKQEQS